MLDIRTEPNDTIVLSGRFDASQVEKARAFFVEISETRTLDFAELDYISSAGLGILLATQKKLSESGHALRLVNVNPHVRDVFHFSGFDRIFQIE
ncbi:MAG TPA: STAS domain-containing protein [Thermoanaerobaculia bacterium]|nr:STAS domain-containing protein [Thermoanaerobaculia bacterium]